MLKVQRVLPLNVGLVRHLKLKTHQPFLPELCVAMMILRMKLTVAFPTCNYHYAVNMSKASEQNEVVLWGMFLNNSLLLSQTF